MNKKLFLLAVIVLTSVFFFSACGYTKEEKINKKNYEKLGKKNAIEYIEKKYSFTPKVISVECDTYNNYPAIDFSPDFTGNVYAEMKHNNEKFWVFISGKEDNAEGYDNYQSDIIREGFLQEMENVLNHKINCIEIGYGLYGTPEFNNKKYGLVNTYYDGTNIKDVLGNANINKASINYVISEKLDIDEEEIMENFGKNSNYAFVNYRNEKGLMLAGEYKTILWGDTTKIKDEALFIKEYIKIEGPDKGLIINGSVNKEYVSFDVKKYGDLYYMTIDGSYCNLIGPHSQYTSKIECDEDLKQIFDTYTLETDGKYVYVWAPIKLIKQYEGKNLFFQAQGVNQGNSIYTNTRKVGQDKYLSGYFYMKDCNKMKFSIFARTN